MQTRREREILRQAYRPARIALLFIGESPPASGRFFYSRNSGLYRAVRDVFRTLDPSIDDENFLAVFQAAGCYLVDLCPEPVDRLDLKSRRAARHAGEASLSEAIRQLQPAAIAVVLRSIAENVEQAVSRAGWRGPLMHLPYPGRWHRHRIAFAEALAPVIGGLLPRGL